jgi:hypothetical protein
MMFASKIIDYTAMPMSEVTKQGAIEVCERCGKPGAYMKFTVPQGTIEKWIHFQQSNFFSHGSCTSCIRTVRPVGGVIKSSWGWTDLQE